jgi:hypothetical protein
MVADVMQSYAQDRRCFVVGGAVGGMVVCATDRGSGGIAIRKHRALGCQR